MNEFSMPTQYSAAATESKWYTAWEAAGLFQPDAHGTKPVYCITIPPPNITGSLHMGHALCYPLQDTLGRYQRLMGKNVLILPGQDHAGIATQSVVDKQLKKKGKSAAALGREGFVERVWEWRKESGDTILAQLRALGCAFDWTRLRFTLDEDYAAAVLKVFIDWFDRGLIFRGKRVVNWDPILQTSVSDIETERKTVRGKLYYVRYPFKDGSGEVVIATTRPETMLADVAVAVHPSDTRYYGLVGKILMLPLMNREITLISDIYPDPAFGSGAVKITPAHDANDYQVGIRHNLPMPVILDERAKVTEAGGKYAGLDRLEARKQIVVDLQEGGFLIKVEDHDIPILISERSGEVIEPLLSEQWFVDQPKLAENVIRQVKAGEVQFHPPRYERIFLDWMENIREWCISRQLWWGHRIPIYYTENGTPIAAMSQEDAERKAGEPILSQDEDVLDTWFSSGLWPFTTLGWPEKTADFETFYPTSTLITDRNIINLWVARMLMMGYDLTGQKPFSDVMIYATVLRDDGRRMSKSLGTGIDPMTIINTIGADALRYTLLSQTGENQDIKYSERKTEEARNFANKIWNATRFVLLNVESAPETPASLEIVDRWLLSRLAATEKEVRRAYDEFDLQSVCQALYRFFWSELCDWYIEVTKSRLSEPESRAAPQWVLLTAIDAFLKMLHPIMPHLTEELYSHLPSANKAPFIMSATWPSIPLEWSDSGAETTVERWFAITRALRALRVEVGLDAKSQVPAVHYVGDLKGGQAVIQSQARIASVIEGDPLGSKFISTTVEGVDLYLPIEGLIDVDKELARLGREAQKTTDDLEKLRLRLNNPQFIERAKPEVVERETQLAGELEENLSKIQMRMTLFTS